MAEVQHEPRVGAEMVEELAAAVGIELPSGLAAALTKGLQASLDAAAELRQLDLAGIGPGPVFTMQRWR